MEVLFWHFSKAIYDDAQSLKKTVRQLTGRHAGAEIENREKSKRRKNELCE